jgi:hypothetical protein
MSRASTLARAVGANGDIAVSGNTTIGDASSDTVTFNAATASIPNGINFTNGNFGIGETSPASKVHVTASTAPTSGSMLRLDNTATTNYSATSYVGGQIRLNYTNSTSRYGGINFSNTGATSQEFFGAVQNSAGYGDFVWQGYGAAGYVERARIDSAGNFGLGVTPSAWASVLAGTIETRAGGLYPYNPGGSAYDYGMFVNAYYDGTWRYKNSSSSAAYYLSASSSSTSTNIRHIWRVAAPGTAGNAITYNDAMYIDAGGRKTTPLQTGFQAWGMSVTSFNASTGSTACLKGGNLPYNQGSGYDSTTGRFTAPVAGTYLVTAAILVESGTGRMEATLYVNGTSQINMNGTGTVYDAPVLTTVIRLAQNDYLTIGRVSGTAYGSAHGNHYFSAYLLG